MAPGKDVPVGDMDEDHLSPQEDAFQTICDVRTSQLRLPITHGPGRDALIRLNTATQETFRQLTRATCYSIGSTLSQGACLLVAVLSMLGFMASAWTGPPADLSKHAVHSLQSFLGKWGTKV